MELSVQVQYNNVEYCGHSSLAPKPPMKLGKQLSIVTSVHSTRIKPMIVHTKKILAWIQKEAWN